MKRFRLEQKKNNYFTVISVQSWILKSNFSVKIDGMTTCENFIKASAFISQNTFSGSLV